MPFWTGLIRTYPPAAESSPPTPTASYSACCPWMNTAACHLPSCPDWPTSSPWPPSPSSLHSVHCWTPSQLSRPIDCAHSWSSSLYSRSLPPRHPSSSAAVSLVCLYWPPSPPRSPPATAPAQCAQKNLRQSSKRRWPAPAGPPRMSCMHSCQSSTWDSGWKGLDLWLCRRCERRTLSMGFHWREEVIRSYAGWTWREIHSLSGLGSPINEWVYY